MDNFNLNILKFDSISLDEMDKVKLLNRTDTKYIMSVNQLHEIFENIQSDYSVLEIDGLRTNRYKTLYFDTPNHQFYMNHHNGKPDRYKVRMRKYVDSGLCYLEVKHKSKGRTDKKRKKIKDFSMELTTKNEGLIEKIFGSSFELKPSLWNSFTRITMVNKMEKERLTIDLNLSFQDAGNEDVEESLNHLVVAEVKQENINRNSKFVQLAKAMGIRSTGMSKYCVGIVLLNKVEKYNAFKTKLLKIEKLKTLNKAS